jgi:UDP-GlcNAc:undecaprenyl-phosphate/decaprenyl-phosphate GlcNAc-1-phosphate transferase
MTGGDIALTLGVGVIAWAVAYGMTPLAGRLAGIIGMVDKPSGRKVHAGAIPYLGGLGILAGWCVALISLGTAVESIALLICMCVLLMTGLMDDRFDISPRMRLSIQMGVAVIAYAGGIRMTPFDNVFGVGIWPLDLLVTVVWLVGMTNAFNFMDNMDGLAAGVGGIAALAFGCLGVLFGQQLVSILGFGLAGACLGFLRHNFHPARIFMGDAGSLPLGFGLAVLAIKVEFPGVDPFVAFCVPIVVLGLFMADTSVMAIGRFQRKEPIIGARLDHISHRLLQRSHPVRRVALRMYAVAALLGIDGILISQLPPAWAWVAVAVSVLSCAIAVALVVRWPIMPVSKQVPGDPLESSG